MEKLLKLLNEYEAKRHKTSVIANIRKGEYRLSYLEMNWNYSELLCISNGYGFIDWLVDNDKIDLVNVIKNIKWCPFDTHYWNMNKYECILMALSISDTPIEDLISYLK